MIKARGTTSDGRPVLLLGLSFGNIVEADRITIHHSADGAPYGFDGDIFIMAGSNEEQMGRMIQDANPGVKTHREENAP